MIEAMRELPDVSVIFVGGARLSVGGDDPCGRLMALAKARGVDGRLRVTGYLTEPEYQRYLSSADLAVCPFEPDKSASGSLSTLIAASCPILASDIPLIAEYNALVPGAIPTFRPYTAGALAAAIRRVLEMPYEKLIQGFDELRERLSLSNVYEQHLSQYRRLVEVPAARKRSPID
jgi:glycosyltransferase involved in cell wall biosynthesis